MHDPKADAGLPDFPRSETLAAVFSKVMRHGEWLPPEELRVVAGFGAAKLDFTQALLAPGVTEVRVFALCGSVELWVSPDLDVDLDASALFGTVERKDGRGGMASFLRGQLRRVTGGDIDPPLQDDDPPVLRVSGYAIFGSIVVRVRA